LPPIATHCHLLLPLGGNEWQTIVFLYGFSIDKSRNLLFDDCHPQNGVAVALGPIATQWQAGGRTMAAKLPPIAT
jgi:hypothetical protein